MLLLLITGLSAQSDYHTIIEEHLRLIQQDTSMELRFKRHNETRAKLINASFPQLKVTDLENKEVDLYKTKEKIVFLNFWFVNCAPCVAEIPGFNELVKHYKDKDILFLAIALDHPRSLKKFLKQQPFNFRIIPDSRELLSNELQHSFGYPTTYILDQDRMIRFVHSGGSTGDDATQKVKDTFMPVLDRLVKK